MKYKGWLKPSRPFPCPLLIGEASGCARVVFLSMLSVICLLFCVGLVFLIAFLVVHPRAPAWDVTGLRITTLELASPTSINVAMRVAMSAHNRMKRQSLSYDPTLVAAFLFEELGGRTTIPPFLQQPLETTPALAASLSTYHLSITTESQLAKLHDVLGNNTTNNQTTTTGNNNLDVHVHVFGRAKVKILRWLKHHYKVRLHCDIIVTLPSQVDSLADSTMTSKDCQQERHWLSRY